MTSAYTLSPSTVTLQTIFDLADTVRKINRGSCIFHEGQKSTEIFYIKSGIVRLSKQSIDGQQLNLRMCKTGDLIGELTLFTNNPHYFLTAEAVTPVEVYVLNRETIEEAVSSNSALAKEFIIWFNTHFQKTHTKFRDLMLFGKKGALYSTLIRMSNTYGIPQSNGSIVIDLQLTNQDLANFCGSTRESVNRFLSSLKSDGVISISGSTITIHNINYLRREIQCEGCSKEICCID